MARSAATLMIDIAADVAKLRTGFEQAERMVNQFGRKMSSLGNMIKLGIGGLAIGATLNGIRSLAAAAGDIGEKAESVGLTTDEFQALSVALAQVGVDGEKAGKAVAKTADFLGKALEGDKGSIDKLRDLGVNLLDAQGNAISMSDAMVDLASAISKIEDPMKRVAAARSIFGRGGESLLPAIQEIAKGFDSLQEKARLGIVSEQASKNFDTFFDRVQLLGTYLKSSFLEALGSAGSDTTFQDSLKEMDGNLVKLSETLREFSRGDWPNLIGTAFAGILAPLNLLVVGLEKLLGLIASIPEAASKAGAWLRSTLSGLGAWVEENASFLPADQAAAEAKRLREQQAVSAAQRAALDFPVIPELDNAPKKRKGGPAVSLPADRGSVDKLKQILDQLKVEFTAVNAAIAELQETSTAPTKEAERLAKMNHDIAVNIAKLQSQTGGMGAAEIQKWVTEVEKAKFKLEEFKETLRVADEVRRQWGDGTRELTDRQNELKAALDANKITNEEYAAAMTAAAQAQELQALKAQEFKTGLEGLSAGFQYAATQWTQSQSAFSQGQQVFSGFIDTLNQGLDSLMGTSSKTFGQIALDFGRMLAKMALQAALSPVFKMLIGSFGGALGAGGMGPPTPGSGFLGWLGGMFGGGRAFGGSVSPGMGYTVGERGPERFVPSVPGAIVPNGGGMGGGVTVNLDMGKTDGARNPSQALEFGRRVRAAVVDVITNEKRPGGLLYGT